MVHHEGGADPASLRILRVRGNSMEPEMRDGDRVVVDTARQSPATGELFVLWDGNGLVVKRVEATGGEPPKLRLISANADYPPCTCLAEEAHIVGKVVWKISRAGPAGASAPPRPDRRAAASGRARVMAP